MKTPIILISVCLLAGMTGFAQNDDLIGVPGKKAIYKEAPEGMVLIPGKGGTGDTARALVIEPFWMSSEITNKEYRKFVTAIRQSPTDTLFWLDTEMLAAEFNKSGRPRSYKDCIKHITYAEIAANIIDTTVWSGQPMYANYFTDKKFDSYPVVGVSWINAFYYCTWRTQLERKQNEEKENYSPVWDYRLPTRDEWEFAAANTGKNNKSPRSTTIGKINKSKANGYSVFNLVTNVKFPR